MRVLLLHEAERELHDAIRWYDDQQTGLGHDFEQEVFKVVARIRQNPLLGSLVEVQPDRDDVRRTTTHRFPITSSMIAAVCLTRCESSPSLTEDDGLTTG